MLPARANDSGWRFLALTDVETRQAMKSRAVFFGQSILLILLITLGKHVFASFGRGLASGSHDGLVLALAYYAIVTILALTVVGIGDLVHARPSGALYQLLGFSWEKCSIRWFLVIAGLWVLPNVANPLLSGVEWKMPKIDSALFIGVSLRRFLRDHRPRMASGISDRLNCSR